MREKYYPEFCTTEMTHQIFCLQLTFKTGGVECYYVRWVLCHHGVARSQVADVGDGLQIWRVAANILNKQLWTDDSGWSSSRGVGCGASYSSL
jgi:hypothetical protein